MVEKETITGRDICLLLYDQKVLKMNRNSYQSLKAGTTSPFAFQHFGHGLLILSNCTLSVT